MPAPTPVMPYLAWISENEEELTIKAAELGLDRDCDFDSEEFATREYEAYCSRCSLGL